MGKISIIYQDNDLLVINKPSGLITHKQNVDDGRPSVVDWALENYPELEGVGDFFIASGREVPRAGIVHRLDKDTSGLMLIARNNKAFSYLQKLFHNRKIKKTYIALVHGRLKNKSGTIDLPLGRLGMKRTVKTEGKKLIDKKEARTEYRTIKNFANYSLLEVRPLTGRTHQIRVHLKAIGHPVVCDPVYGEKQFSCPSDLGRLFLHAQKLSFTTPDGKSLTVETDLPKVLTNFLQKIE